MSSRDPFDTSLAHIMYGFGDDECPLPESREILKDLVILFIKELAIKAQERSNPNKQTVVAEDVIAVVRKYPRRFYKARESYKHALQFARARAEDEKIDEKKLARTYGD